MSFHNKMYNVIIKNTSTRSCDVQKLWMGERQISEESSDSDSDDENIDDGVSDRNAKIVTIKVGSLRTDLIVKAGLSIARNKVENLFYESRIRVNGRKILKKSAQVHIGDEVDVIRGVSPMNPKFLLVSRLEILSMKGEEENINVKLRRFKSLTIENYTDTWKESTSSSES
ncbi:mitochondrial transcription rescue factor 1 isoform X2 [Periplaneta americana]|uniref:mitochondrial transcription rescue factor 1 isoform X2 n=1 Tax=Periplaneta americana TaxID=6978 RepID=UPI0037E8D4A0